MCSLFYLFLYLFVSYCFSINCRLRYKGTPEYLGESVTVIEIRIWNLHSGSYMVGKGKEVGDVGGCTGELV